METGVDIQQTELDNNPQRIIKINQRFSLFSPPAQNSPLHGEKVGFPIDQKNADYRYRNPKIHPPTFILETKYANIEGLPNLPFEVEGVTNRYPYDQTWYMTRQFLTPFNQKLGYQLGNEDYDLEKRIEKLLELKTIEDQKNPWPSLTERLSTFKKKLRKEELPQSPFIKSSEVARLFITCQIAGKMLEKLGLAEPIKTTIGGFTLSESDKTQEQDMELGPFVLDGFRLDERVFDALQRLRLQLFFPDSQGFEAKPMEDALQKLGYPLFELFYPIGKPLATATEQQVILDRRLKRLQDIKKEGLGILIPPTIDALSKIQGMFVLTPKSRP